MSDADPRRLLRLAVKIIEREREVMFRLNGMIAQPYARKRILGYDRFLKPAREWLKAGREK